jgi:twinkle protein
MEMAKILELRGINEDTASRLGLRVSDDWLEMPVIRDGVELGYKRRKFGDDKAFMQKKGTPQIFYNIDALKAFGAEPLIITEGEMDCAIALQCGFLAVSVPNGAPMEQLEQGGTKYAYLDDLPKQGEVILAFDNDQPGANLLHDISSRIGKARCRWMQYPVGCKDLNDTFLKYGRKGVEAAVKRASWMKVSGVGKMEDLPPPAFIEAIPCPVEGMAELYKLRLGDFTVITGIPGMGKTTFANELAASMAIRHGWNIGVASFEQSPRYDFEPWLHSHYHGRPAHMLTPEERDTAAKWVHKHFTLITPTEDEDIDLLWLKERIEVLALRHDCKLVIIDPWNELDHIHPRELSQTEYTGFAIRQLKKLATRLRIHLIVITHPAKMMRNKDGEYPVPSLYDIADSAHWRNKADMGIIVHRDDEQSSRIIVAKCRYWGKIGKNGEAEVRYDDYRHRYVSKQNYG